MCITAYILDSSSHSAPLKTQQQKRAVWQPSFPFQTSVFLLWRNIASLRVSHSVIIFRSLFVRLYHICRLPEKTQLLLSIKLLGHEAEALLFHSLYLHSNLLLVNSFIFQICQYKEFKPARWKYLHEITEKFHVVILWMSSRNYWKSLAIYCLAIQYLRFPVTSSVVLKLRKINYSFACYTNVCFYWVTLQKELTWYSRVHEESWRTFIYLLYDQIPCKNKPWEQEQEA